MVRNLGSGESCTSKRKCEQVGTPTSQAKKRRVSGRFKGTWKLPVGIRESFKSSQLAYRTLCKNDFSVGTW